MAGSRKISVHKYKPILVNRTVHAPAIKNYEHAASMIMMMTLSCNIRRTRA